MASIKRNSNENQETIKTLLECIKVNNKEDYISICNKFENETETVQERELVEIENVFSYRTEYLSMTNFLW